MKQYLLLDINSACKKTFGSLLEKAVTSIPNNNWTVAVIPQSGITNESPSDSQKQNDFPSISDSTANYTIWELRHKNTPIIQFQILDFTQNFYRLVFGDAKNDPHPETFDERVQNNFSTIAQLIETMSEAKHVILMLSESTLCQLYEEKELEFFAFEMGSIVATIQEVFKIHIEGLLFKSVSTNVENVQTITNYIHNILSKKKVYQIENSSLDTFLHVLTLPPKTPSDSLSSRPLTMQLQDFDTWINSAKEHTYERNKTSLSILLKHWFHVSESAFPLLSIPPQLESDFKKIDHHQKTFYPTSLLEKTALKAIEAETDFAFNIQNTILLDIDREERKQKIFREKQELEKKKREEQKHKLKRLLRTSVIIFILGTLSAVTIHHFYTQPDAYYRRALKADKNRQYAQTIRTMHTALEKGSGEAALWFANAFASGYGNTHFGLKKDLDKTEIYLIQAKKLLPNTSDKNLTKLYLQLADHYRNPNTYSIKEVFYLSKASYGSPQIAEFRLADIWIKEYLKAKSSEKETWKNNLKTLTQSSALVKFCKIALNSGTEEQDIIVGTLFDILMQMNNLELAEMVLQRYAHLKHCQSMQMELKRDFSLIPNPPKDFTPDKFDEFDYSNQLKIYQSLLDKLKAYAKNHSPDHELVKVLQTYELGSGPGTKNISDIEEKKNLACINSISALKEAVFKGRRDALPLLIRELTTSAHYDQAFFLALVYAHSNPGIAYLSTKEKYQLMERSAKAAGNYRFSRLWKNAANML